VSGDAKLVEYILTSIKDFNIEITDDLGRTALRLAVINENNDVIQLLLSKTDSQKLREALLLSIFIGHTVTAELIMKHPQYKIFNEKKFLDGATDSFWQTSSSNDAQFSPDITPIMLASQYNRTNIVQLLLLTGDRIEKPHEYYCDCQECDNRSKFDSLRFAQSRLNAYRGLASQTYTSLVSEDPILTAFEIGNELKYLSDKEKYFKAEYLSLISDLKKYTVRLLDNVRGRDELETLLNKTGKENEEKYELLARLNLALNYEEMNVN
jgi:ankyrin repeat protein